MSSQTITSGQKLYTVMQGVALKSGKTAYIPLGCGIFVTRLEASRAMRKAGGGKKGSRKDLVVYSFDFEGKQEADYVVDVTVTVRAKSQAEADQLVNDILDNLN